MKNSGVAVMGMGIGSRGEQGRSRYRKCTASPLLNSSDITGARSILIIYHQEQANMN
jgi:cell division GTPase FtsZ